MKKWKLCSKEIFTNGRCKYWMGNKGNGFNPTFDNAESARKSLEKGGISWEIAKNMLELVEVEQFDV